MTDVTLYRYEREDGGIDVSPIRPEGTEYTTLHRLIADEGMELVKDETRTPCIDTDDISGWAEEPAVEEEPEDE